MTNRQFWDLEYLRACSLPTSGFLSSDLASKTMSGRPLASSSRKWMKPLLVFSKFSPRASRSDDFMVTLGSRWMLAGFFPSEKKRQPAASSSLLILIRAVASLSDALVPVSAWVLIRLWPTGWRPNLAGARSPRGAYLRVSGGVLAAKRWLRQPSYRDRLSAFAGG